MRDFLKIDLCMLVNFLRMGADIQLNGNIATIIGEKKFKWNRCYGNRFKSIFCLVLAALVAQGETNIHRIYHLDRGI